MSVENRNRVRVETLQLAAALQPCVSMSRKRGRATRAKLAVHGGVLQISLGAVVGKVPVAGTWSGEADVSADLLLGLARAVPTAPYLEFRVVDETFLISGAGIRVSSACTWSETPEP